MWLFVVHTLFFIFAISTSVLFVYSALHSYDDLRYAFIAFSCAAITLSIYAFLLLQPHYGLHFSCSCEMKDIFALVATFFLLCGGIFMVRLVKHARSK